MKLDCLEEVEANWNLADRTWYGHWDAVRPVAGSFTHMNKTRAFTSLEEIRVFFGRRCFIIVGHPHIYSEEAVSRFG